MGPNNTTGPRLGAVDSRNQVAKEPGEEGKLAEDSGSEKGLHCLGGQAPPEALEHGWQALEGLPKGDASAAFWDLLGAFLSEPGHPSHDQLLQSYVDTHKVDVQEVLTAMDACNQLLNQSVALDISDAHFQEDVETLAGGKTAQGVELIRRYAGARPVLRRRVIEESLSDHGNVLVGLDWRLDRVEASDRGNQLNASVVFLTLNYRDRDDVKRITLQLVPESLQLLKSFTDRFGGQG